MRRHFCRLIWLAMLVPLAAPASHWIECEVDAWLLETAVASEETPGGLVLIIDVRSSRITDGMVLPGGDCVPTGERRIELVARSVLAPSQLTAGSRHLFHYTDYGALTPSGPMQTQNWRLIGN